MGNSTEFKRAVGLVVENVSFDKQTTIQVFEATIRCFFQDITNFLPAATKLGQGNIFTSVCLSTGGGGVCLSACWDIQPPSIPCPPGADPPPGKQTPAYGQRAAGTHPTEMHSCYIWLEVVWPRMLMSTMYFRVLGALISAHLIITDPDQPFGHMVPEDYDNELLQMAHDLAARLLPAFERTATGIPFPRVSSTTFILNKL